MSGAVYQALPLARRHKVATKRQPLLSSCAVAAAMVAAGHAAPVYAQAFQAGNPAVNSGIATRNITSATTETIVIDSPTAVLTWTPSDTGVGGGAIDYLPTGNVATFAGGINVSDYTVLNRIIPADTSRAVAFNGTVLSTIGVDPVVTGGNLWFYSPGGILVGSTGAFDVGSLILSANDIDTTGGLFGPGGTIRFRGATDSRSAVTVEAGATINAANSGSYVALVAPRVNQGGLVNVNGSAAYVAAESADITINGGLFDIAIQTGSTVDPGGETTLVHSGTTTGPGPTGPNPLSDPQFVYMVAVPKNDAITMLVGGTVGYGAAGAAIENGTVVLSAGYGLTSGNDGSGSPIANATSQPSTEDASIVISGGNFTSRVSGYAVTDATATGGGSTLNFDSALNLQAGRNASLIADAGDTITVGGSVDIQTTNLDSSGASAAGQASAQARGGGTITVLGGVTANASALGGVAGTVLFNTAGIGSLLDFRRESFLLANNTGSTPSALAQGGSALVTQNGGTLLVGEQLQLQANATGANSTSVGGAGTGGTASITSTNSASITVGGPLLLSANGVGGRGATGGAGSGGTAELSLQDSNLTLDLSGSPQTLEIRAQGTGGAGLSGGTGGAGQGGDVGLAFFNSAPVGITSNLLAGSILLDATASGGGIENGYGTPMGGSGGTATGGTATFKLGLTTGGGGTLTASNIFLDAGASGGDGSNAFDGPDGGAGADATGGTASFTVENGTLTSDSVSLYANGDGGFGGDAFESGYGTSGAGGIGGNGTGGDALFLQNGGSVTVSALDIRSGGGGGGGGFSSSAAAGGGGTGEGGNASFSISGGTQTFDSLITVFADGFGGSGGNSDTLLLGGLGGTGQGGNADFEIQGGTSTIAGLILSGSALGGGGGFGTGFNEAAAGGAGRGGTASFGISAGTATIGDLRVEAIGGGADAFSSATSGEARGGTAGIVIGGGSLSVTSFIDVNASGGLDGAEGGSAAPVFGGTASITVENGGVLDYSNSSGSIFISADAFASSNSAGIGGNATGGTASFTVDNATVDLGAASLNLLAQGGGGSVSFSSAPGAGGNGTGGTTAISVVNGGSLLTTGSVQLESSGFGGGVNGFGYGSVGGIGGNGIGGTASFEVEDGTISIAGSTSLNAGGGGGQGLDADGGAGTGGIVEITSGGTTGLIDLSNLSINIAGRGNRSSESGYGAAGAGGNGGAGTGGTATILATGGNIAVASVNVSAGGEGGDGASVFSSANRTAGNGGAATGGTMTVRADAGDIAINSLLVDAGGAAGSGGGQSNGSGVGSAGDGGNATGGSVTIGTGGGTLTLADVAIFAQADGGFGGFGSGGTSGGNGGNAVGGTVTFTASDSEFDVTGLNFNVPISGRSGINISANGGFGGSAGSASGAGGAGGNGGSATGGTLILSSSGVDGSLLFDPNGLFNSSEPSIDNHSRGGDGGFGGFGTTGGAGGNGGNALGGTIEIGTDLGSVTFDDENGTPALSVTAVAGQGGEGGDGSTVGNTGGVGGNGGDGTGGTIRVRVNGGSVDLASVEFYAHGNGGLGGNGGQGTPTPADPGNPSAIPPIPPTPQGPTPFASSGSTGRGFGGTISVNVADNIDDGTAGSASFDDAYFEVVGRDANGFDDVTGRIEIYDNGTDTDGGIEFGSLDVLGRGFSFTSDHALDFYSGSRRINVLGDAFLQYGGPVYFRASDTGGLDIGGDLNVNSGWFISVQHDSQPGTPVNTIAANNIFAGSLFEFTADPDSRIFSRGDIDIGSSFSTVAVNYASADGSIFLSAPGDISAGTLLARAPSFGGRFTAIGIETDGDVSVGNAATTVGDIDIDISGSITAGTLSAGDSVRLLAGGTITTGALTGGTFSGGGSVSGFLGSVGAGSFGDINVASANALNDIAFATAGTVTTGALVAGRDVGIVATGDITVDSVDAVGEFFVGNSSVIEDLDLLGGLELEDLPTVLATTPVRTDGGLFVADGIDASNIRIAVGGLADIGSAFANGEFGYGGIVSGGNIDINAGSIAIDAAEAFRNVRLTTAPSGNAFLAPPVSGGTIEAGSLIAGQDIDVDALDAISVGSASAVRDVSLVGSTALEAGTVSGGRDVQIAATNSIEAGDVSGGRDVDIVTLLRAGDTSTTLSRSIAINSAEAGDDLVVAAFGAVDAGTLRTTRSGQDGTAISGSQYPNQSGSSVYVISEKGAKVGTLQAADNALLLNVAESRNGVQISDGSGGITVSLLTAGGNVDLTSALSGVAVTSNITAGGLVGASSTDVTLNALGDLRLANVTATVGAVVVNAGGTLGIQGSISAPTIQLASHDISIGTSALVGNQSVTDTLTLINNGRSRTVIGGGDESQAYSLSNTEFGRLSAHEINIFGAAGSGADTSVLVRQLDIIGSAGADTASRRKNLTGSELFIRSNGSLTIDGAVALTSAGVDDTLIFDASDRIRVVTPNGSVTATGAQNALAGTIVMSANEILVSSAQAADDIAKLTTTDAIDERLGTNDGPVKAEGYLQVNALEFNIRNALYIQNSGGPGLGSAARAGFTAGGGGVSINTGTGGNARIVINGRQSEGGVFVGGAGLIPLLSINGQHNPSGGFDLRSTANGCLIVSQSCRFDGEEIEIPPVPPVQDVIKQIVDAPDNEANQDGTAVVQALNLPLIQLVDYDGLSFEPLIDEPVTGTGNDDFWVGDDDEGE